jgi:hypothetical protein
MKLLTVLGILWQYSSISSRSSVRQILESERGNSKFLEQIDRGALAKSLREIVDEIPVIEGKKEGSCIVQVELSLRA